MNDSNPQSTSEYLLGQIDAKVSHLLASMDAHKEDSKEKHNQLATRISNNSARIASVEKKQWQIAGVTAAVPVVLTIIGLLLAYNNMK